jgi:hypothetical protein
MRRSTETVKIFLYFSALERLNDKFNALGNEKTGVSDNAKITKFRIRIRIFLETKGERRLLSFETRVQEGKHSKWDFVAFQTFVGYRFRSF